MYITDDLCVLVEQTYHIVLTITTSTRGFRSGTVAWRGQEVVSVSSARSAVGGTASK
jgi:hypothetical protein